MYGREGGGLANFWTKFTKKTIKNVFSIRVRNFLFSIPVVTINKILIKIKKVKNNLFGGEIINSGTN